MTVAVNIDQADVVVSQSARFEEEKNINYIEKRLKPKFPWLQLSEGKLFCKVRNTGGYVQLINSGINTKNLGLMMYYVFIKYFTVYTL